MNRPLYIHNFLAYIGLFRKMQWVGKLCLKEYFNCSDIFLANSFDDRRREWQT